MSLKLVRRHGSPTWYIRGTVRGIAVDQSTRTHDRAAAEAIRIREEHRLLDRSIHGVRATVSFMEAAVATSIARAAARAEIGDRLAMIAEEAAQRIKFFEIVSLRHQCQMASLPTRSISRAPSDVRNSCGALAGSPYRRQCHLSSNSTTGRHLASVFFAPRSAKGS